MRAYGGEKKILEYKIPQIVIFFCLFSYIFKVF